MHTVVDLPHYLTTAKASSMTDDDRVVTFYSGVDIPVFLMAAYSKGERANLSQAERNELRSVLGELARSYREGLRHHVQGRKRHHQGRP